MGKPRELLIELIGEEMTDLYFEGGAITIEVETYNYTIERKRGYADIVRRVNKRDAYTYRSTDSGRLRAWNIDDAVAAFIQAAKVGKVNWGCGNIDVRLPSNMPPKNLSLITFLTRGIRTILYAIAMIPSKYSELLGSDDAFIAIMGGIILPWVIGLGLMSVLLDRIVIPRIIGYVAVLWPIPVMFSTGYSRWKQSWEVKMT